MAADPAKAGALQQIGVGTLMLSAGVVAGIATDKLVGFTEDQVDPAVGPLIADILFQGAILAGVGIAMDYALISRIDSKEKVGAAMYVVGVACSMPEFVSKVAKLSAKLGNWNAYTIIVDDIKDAYQSVTGVFGADNPVGENPTSSK